MGEASDQSSLASTLEWGRVSGEEGGGDAEDDGWGAVATQENNLVASLEAAMADAEDAAGSETDPEAEEKTSACAAATISVFERLHRYESLRGLTEGQAPMDDPFWAEYFFQLVETLDEVYATNAKGNLQARVRLLSGCSGMLAEGWACKAGSKRGAMLLALEL